MIGASFLSDDVVRRGATRPRVRSWLLRLDVVLSRRLARLLAHASAHRLLPRIRVLGSEGKSGAEEKRMRVALSAQFY